MSNEMETIELEIQHEPVIVKVETNKMKLGDTFEQYGEFKQVFDEMSAETFQMWCGRTSSYRDEERTMPKCMKYICIYNKDPNEIKSKGKNVRPNQRYQATGCKAEVHVNFEVSKSLNKYVVKKFNLEHNHPINQNRYDFHPRNRKIDEDYQQMALDMLKTGSKPAKVAALIEEKTGKKVISKDLHNLAQKQSLLSIGKTRSTNTIEEEIAKIYLIIQQQRDKDGDDNFVIGKTDDTNEIYMIFYQNEDMRNSYRKFGKILFIDSTYMLNLNNYPCVVISVQDNYGKARVVGFALVAYEREGILRKVFEVFAERNDAKTPVAIMIDKDLTEEKVLNEVFKEARTLYCWFHVEKTFKLHFNKKQLQLLETLYRSHNSISFETNLEAVKASLSEEKLQYLEKNWLSCPEKWIKYHRTGLPTLLNETNNTSESVNNCLKQWIKRGSPISKCITNFLEYLAFGKKSVLFRDFYEETTILRKQNSDEVVDLIMNSVPKTFTKWLINQYELSKQCSYQVSEVLDTITLKSKKDQYSVSKFQSDSPVCSCYEFQSMLLPCRHVFYARKLKNLSIFQRTMIPTRSKLTKDAVYDSSSTPPSSQTVIIPTIEEDLNLIDDTVADSVQQQSNYSTISRLCQELAQCLIQCDPSKYKEKLRLFLLIKSLFEKDIDFVPKILNSNVNDILEDLDVSIFEEESEEPPSKKQRQTEPMPIEPLTNTQEPPPTLNVIQINSIISKTGCLVKKAAKRGAPKKIKQNNRFEKTNKSKKNTQQVAIENSTPLAIVSSNISQSINPQLTDFIQLISNFNINNLNSSTKIDEQHIHVTIDNIPRKILQIHTKLKDLNINLNNYFTEDAILQINSTLSQFENHHICPCCKKTSNKLSISCNSCDEWYHRRCVKLTTAQATNLTVWICHNCIN